MKNNILLIGPFPEPKGGVSIHLDRLAKLLEEQYDVTRMDESPIVKDSIFNIRSLNFFKYFQLIMNSDIVHIQGSINIVRNTHILVAKLLRKRTIVTIHSWRNKTEKQSKVFKFFLSFVNQVIVVNKEIAIGLSLEKYIVKPAFLPPDSFELADIPKELKDIIEKKKSEGNFLVSSNAYQLANHKGEDLYGLDMFVALVEYFREEKIFFIFQLASLGGEDLKGKYYQFVDLIKEKKLDNMLLYVKPMSFVSLINTSDLTLRLTNTDGDALSIRESIYLDTPIIASDVTDRPVGTILFKTRDIEDLKQVFKQIYEQRKENVIDIETSYNSRESYLDFYKQIYLIKEKK